MQQIATQNHRLAFQNLWLGLGVVLIALLLYGSLAPPQVLPAIGESDKVWHGACYAVVMAYLSQVYRSLGSRVGIALTLIALGIVIEFIQPYVNRSFDWGDALANGIGVAVALTLSFSPLNRLLPYVDERLKRSFGRKPWGASTASERSCVSFTDSRATKR